MKLTYTHWQGATVTRDVTPLRGIGNYYHDRARVYFIGPFTGEVFNAGDVLHGNPRLKTNVRIGWDGSVK